MTNHLQKPFCTKNKEIDLPSTFSPNKCLNEPSHYNHERQLANFSYQAT